MLPTEHAPAPGDAAAAGTPTPPDGPTPALPWLRILAATAGRAVLMLAVTMAFWSSAPALLGLQTTTVVTGSMEPAIAVGDVVAALPVGTENLTIGRVVLLDDPDHAGRLRLHRIAAVNPDGSLTLRGDANTGNDSTSVWPSAVHGVGYLRIPAAGLPMLWIKTGQWLQLAALAAALTGAFALTRLDKQLVRGRPGTEKDVGSRPKTDARRRLLPAASVVAALSIAAGLAGAAMLAAPVAHAAFSGSSPNTANTLASRPFFSCTAAVLSDSPSLFFAFNDTPAPATTVTDSSGNATNGTFQTTASLNAAIPCAGDAGKSADLAGTRYISTGGTAKAPPTVFSYEMWFKTSSTLGGFQNTQTGTSTTNDRNLYMRSDGKLVFGVAPGGTMQTIISPAGYNDGNWHHTAVTLSSAGMKLHVDGANVATAAGTTAARTGYTGWWRFGNGTLTGWPGAGTTAFNGQMENIAVYNTTALTPAQILAHYQAGLP